MSIKATPKLDHEQYIRDIADNLAVGIKNALDRMSINCTICEHFSGEEKCKLYNARPPANVIIKGCDKFKEDEIPF